MFNINIHAAQRRDWSACQGKTLRLELLPYSFKYKL